MPINFIQLTQGSLDSKIRKQKKKKNKRPFSGRQRLKNTP